MSKGAGNDAITWLECSLTLATQERLTWNAVVPLTRRNASSWMLRLGLASWKKRGITQVCLRKNGYHRHREAQHTPTLGSIDSSPTIFWSVVNMIDADVLRLKLVLSRQNIESLHPSSTRKFDDDSGSTQMGCVGLWKCFSLQLR